MINTIGKKNRPMPKHLKKTLISVDNISRSLITNAACIVSKLSVCCFARSPDPNMVNAYMYQTAGTNGQPAPPGQAPPTTSPPYSSYQPTPTQGYQVRPTPPGRDPTQTNAVAKGLKVTP